GGEVVRGRDRDAVRAVREPGQLEAGDTGLVGVGGVAERLRHVGPRRGVVVHGDDDRVLRLVPGRHDAVIIGKGYLQRGVRAHAPWTAPERTPDARGLR